MTLLKKYLILWEIGKMITKTKKMAMLEILQMLVLTFLYYDQESLRVSRLAGAYVCTLNFSLRPILKALHVWGSP